MPEETPDEIAVREAAEADAAADAANTPTPEQAIEAAKAEAATARAEAEKAKTDGQTALATAAEQRADAADERAKLADQRAKDAANAKAEDGSKKYSEDYVKKLRDEAAKHRISSNDVKDELKKLKDLAKTEAERVSGAIKDAEARAEKAEKELLRIQVAGDKKVPAHLASRLVGDTKEELEADADKLLKDVAPATGQGLDGGSRGAGSGSGKPDDMNSWLRKTSGITQ